MNQRTLRSSSACCNVRFARVRHGMGGSCQGLQCSFPYAGAIQYWEAGSKGKPQKSSPVSQRRAFCETKFRSTQATLGDMSLNSVARRLAVTPRTISELLDEQT